MARGPPRRAQRDGRGAQRRPRARTQSMGSRRDHHPGQQPDELRPARRATGSSARRRPFRVLVGAGELPVCRLEPAVLMFAAHEPHLRTALGAVAATVQQRLTTADSLVAWLDRLTPLRRSRELRDLLSDVGDGAHSMAEVDLRKACRDYGVQPPQSQRSRTDSRGRGATPMPSGDWPTVGCSSSRWTVACTTTRAGDARPPAQPAAHQRHADGRAVLGLGDPARAVGGDAGPGWPSAYPRRVECAAPRPLLPRAHSTQRASVSARRRRAGRRRRRGRGRCSPCR